MTVVVGAVIVDSISAPRRVLGACKARGGDAGMWEFPGGKVEPGESAADALRREIREELDVDIVTHASIGEWPISDDVRLVLILAACDGSIRIGPDHSGVRWFAPAELADVTWLPADELALPAIAELLSG